MTARTTRHVWFLGLWLLLPWPLFVTADAFVISACGDASVPRTIQERAWTSPIWYSPQAEQENR